MKDWKDCTQWPVIQQKQGAKIDGLQALPRNLFDPRIINLYVIKAPFVQAHER